MRAGSRKSVTTRSGDLVRLAGVIVGSTVGVHTFTQFLTRFEVRYVFCRQRDRRSSLGIASNPPWTVVQGEASESPNFDSATAGESFTHLLQHGSHREFDIPVGQLRLLLRNAFYQLRFCHHPFHSQSNYLFFSLSGIPAPLFAHRIPAAPQKSNSASRRYRGKNIHSCLRIDPTSALRRGFHRATMRTSPRLKSGQYATQFWTPVFPRP